MWRNFTMLNRDLAPAEPVATPVANPTVPNPVANHPSPMPEPSGGKPNPPTFTVPEQFSDREWAKNIKDIPDLFNQFDNAQKMIGKKRISVPSEKATPEEVSEFHKALGVPDKADAYEFEQIEPFKDLERDVNIDLKVKEIFKKHGIPKSAAKSLVADYENLRYELSKSNIEEAQKANMEFEKYLDDTYGAEKEQRIVEFRKTISELDPQISGMVNSVSDDGIKILMAAVDDLGQKYGKEGKFISKSGSSGSVNKTQSQIFQELTALHAKYAGVRPMTPEYQEYVATENKLKVELEQVLNLKK